MAGSSLILSLGEGVRMSGDTDDSELSDRVGDGLGTGDEGA